MSAWIICGYFVMWFNSSSCMVLSIMIKRTEKALLVGSVEFLSILQFCIYFLIFIFVWRGNERQDCNNPMSRMCFVSSIDSHNFRKVICKMIVIMHHVFLAQVLLSLSTLCVSNKLVFGSRSWVDFFCNLEDMSCDILIELNLLTTMHVNGRSPQVDVKSCEHALFSLKG